MDVHARRRLMFPCKQGLENALRCPKGRTLIYTAHAEIAGTLPGNDLVCVPTPHFHARPAATGSGAALNLTH